MCYTEWSAMKVRVTNPVRVEAVVCQRIAAISSSLSPPTMLAAASLAIAFSMPACLAPSRPSLVPSRPSLPLMSESSSEDRFSFEDPRQILTNFFNPAGTPAYVTGLDKDGRVAGVEKFKDAPAGDALDLVQDSCIDWGALTPREVAAAFMMLKGGSKEAAEATLLATLEELKTMETADWGLMAASSNDEKPAAKTKFYSGM